MTTSITRRTTITIVAGQTNRTMHYDFAPAFYKFTHLINPTSSDGRTIDKIPEEEILFLNMLWSFCEDEYI